MQNITIDITKRGVAPLVNVTDYDAMSRFFALTILDGGAPYTPPDGATYSVWYKNNESHGWYDTITEPDDGTHPAITADGNVLTVEIAAAATTSCGELAVMITGADGYQLTVTGIMTRSADIPGYDGEEVENYYNVYITEMRENAARAENAAATAIEYGASVEVDETAQQLIITHTDNTEDVQTWVTEAEAWAVGQRNGEDVPSTDETYHNNAKYYAQVAQESAGGASPIVTEASGSVAAFPDGANDVAVKSLVAEITPVQSGSGDPSPTNVREISGRTGLTVKRCGKNLLQNTLTSFTNRGITATANADGTVTLTGTNDGSSYSVFVINDFYAVDGVEYILSGAVSANILLRNVGAAVTDTGNGVSFTGDGTSQRIEIRVLAGTSISGSVVVKPMVRPASISDGTFVPYTAQTYPITWQTEAGTVYGGTLDVVSGVLTVKRFFKAFDGTEDWARTGSIGANTNRYYIQWGNMGITGNVINLSDSVCSHLVFLSGNVGQFGTFNASTTNFAVKDGNGTQFADMAAFKSWLAAQNTNGTPLQLCVELATPQTYNITPTEVKTLLGGNTIYTDAGAVSVEYVADTKLYIDNKVAELQALILEN